MKELEYPFDPAYILKKRKAIKKNLIIEEKQFIPIRIAVLGGSTTTDIVSVLELFLLNWGIQPEFYESDFGKYYEDALFGNEKLDKFCPDIVYLHISAHNLKYLPGLTDSIDTVNRNLECEYDNLLKIWDTITVKYKCVIIQDNFVRPASGLYGNQDIAEIKGIANFVSRLNQKIYEHKQVHSHFYIHDVEGLAAEYGLRRWQDARYWYLYKYSLTMEAIPEFAYHLGTIIKSLYGRNHKAIILDADNTLWDGIIGECGAQGIDISRETGRGQAFRDWQTYLKQLKKRGILLAIASKNEADSVKEGLKHPDSVLKIEDFAAMKVNWEDKASNILSLSQELNICPDQMVFIDDNPAERELVRQKLPQVAVIEADTPEQFMECLNQKRLFELTELTEEDLGRTELYRENTNREQAKLEYADYQEYLSSLQMKANIGKFQAGHISRITQLINKTNQFNLTTKRMTEEEVRVAAQDPEWICLEGQLTDRFGDNGIVSILMGDEKNGTFHIRVFLLSCRVFKRDMECVMLDALVLHCRKRGIRFLRGYYIPTKKNGIVENFFKEMGFSLIEGETNLTTVWEMDVEKYCFKNSKIDVRCYDEQRGIYE